MDRRREGTRGNEASVCRGRRWGLRGLYDVGSWVRVCTSSSAVAVRGGSTPGVGRSLHVLWGWGSDWSARPRSSLSLSDPNGHGSTSSSLPPPCHHREVTRRTAGAGLTGRVPSHRLHAPGPLRRSDGRLGMGGWRRRYRMGHWSVGVTRWWSTMVWVESLTVCPECLTTLLYGQTLTDGRGRGPDHLLPKPPLVLSLRVEVGGGWRTIGVRVEGRDLNLKGEIVSGKGVWGL